MTVYNIDLERTYCVDLLHKDDQHKDPPVNLTVGID